MGIHVCDYCGRGVTSISRVSGRFLGDEVKVCGECMARLGAAYKKMLDIFDVVTARKEKSRSRSD